MCVRVCVCVAVMCVCVRTRTHTRVVCGSNNVLLMLLAALLLLLCVAAAMWNRAARINYPITRHNMLCLFHLRLQSASRPPPPPHNKRHTTRTHARTRSPRHVRTLNVRALMRRVDVCSVQYSSLQYTQNTRQRSCVRWKPRTCAQSHQRR